MQPTPPVDYPWMELKKNIPSTIGANSSSNRAERTKAQPVTTSKNG